MCCVAWCMWRLCLICWIELNSLFFNCCVMCECTISVYIYIYSKEIKKHNVLTPSRGLVRGNYLHMCSSVLILWTKSSSTFIWHIEISQRSLGCREPNTWPDHPGLAYRTNPPTHYSFTKQRVVSRLKNASTTPPPQTTLLTPQTPQLKQPSKHSSSDSFHTVFTGWGPCSCSLLSAFIVRRGEVDYFID